MSARNEQEKELKKWLWKSRFGSLRAYDLIVARFQKLILTFTTYMFSDMQSGEDVAFEIFLEAFRQLKTKPRREPFAVWLFRLGFNKAVEKLPPFLPQELGPMAQVNAPNLFQQIEVEHRAVLIFHDLVGLSESEIAAVLGVSLGTIRTRLQAARLKFKSLLKKHALLEVA